MRTSPIRLLSIAFLVALVLGVATQLQAQTVVTCDVPFDFSVGGQTYSSGVYTFTVGTSSGSRVVLLRNAEGSDGRFLLAGVQDETQKVDTVLRFSRYGTHYLLSSLAIGDSDISLTFTPSRSEREMLVGAKRDELVTVLAMR